jgi:hypothetical protein
MLCGAMGREDIDKVLKRNRRRESLAPASHNAALHRIKALEGFLDGKRAIAICI